MSCRSSAARYSFVTSTEPSRFALSSPIRAFGEVHKENSLVVHNEAQINRAPGLADDVSQGRAREKLADFVLNRRGDFFFEVAADTSQNPPSKTISRRGL